MKLNPTPIVFLPKSNLDFILALFEIFQTDFAQQEEVLSLDQSVFTGVD